MADEGKSMSTLAIVLIVIVLLILGFLIFRGRFGGENDGGTDINVEVPAPGGGEGY